MKYISHYNSPIGGILLAADDEGLTGLWFDGAKYYGYGLGLDHKECALPVFDDAVQWLDTYFSGQKPDFFPAIHMIGSPFQLEVWSLLQKIPYGQTVTYGALSKAIAAERGISSMSAQAVGGAVGRNRLSILIPCHRVVGTGGSLTGYAGGVEKKRFLLNLEGAAMQN